MGMFSRRFASYLVVAAGLALTLTGPSLAQSRGQEVTIRDAKELVESLRSGGYVIVVRHGATNADGAVGRCGSRRSRGVRGHHHQGRAFIPYILPRCPAASTQSEAADRDHHGIPRRLHRGNPGAHRTCHGERPSVRSPARTRLEVAQPTEPDCRTVDNARFRSDPSPRRR